MHMSIHTYTWFSLNIYAYTHMYISICILVPARGHLHGELQASREGRRYRDAGGELLATRRLRCQKSNIRATSYGGREGGGGGRGGVGGFK